MWVGVDDTDGPNAGCTTWVLTELLRLGRELDLDPIGLPRLVRLNPNVPFKTRGNAALSVRLGHGHGPAQRAGAIDGAPVRVYERGRNPSPADREEFTERAWKRVVESAPDVEGTDPAMVVTARRPSAGLYWKAVRELVPVGEARRALEKVGALVRLRGDAQGLVGAAASLAWPARRVTWELIAYRRAERLGTPRSVDSASVRAAERSDPHLFLCHDPATRRLLVAPHTACPILYGLRATDPRSALRSMRTVRSEEVDRWVLFRTNQATGDHLLPRTAQEIGPYTSAIVRGTVVGLPHVRPGGHVSFRVADRVGAEVECLAFEPTKTLPRIAQNLRAGDRVVVWGGTAEDPALRLEGIRLLRTARTTLRAPPPCPACGLVTRSLGTGRGFKCPGCGGRLPPERAVRRSVARTAVPGEYLPTASARRHLAVLAA